MGKFKNINKKKASKRRRTWAIKMFFITLIISIIFSTISQKAFDTSDTFIFPLFTILIIIIIGVVFDIIGIAVAAAREKPFLSMSSKKIRGARQALDLIKNADLVSNFCNDVVGDICGIVSGAAGGMLVINMISTGLELDFLSILMSSLIAALTVGGKSLGKGFAMDNAQQIIHGAGYFLSLFVFRTNKKNSNRLPIKKED
ncbi:MAG TPA: hypothetical protein VFD57_06830 [Clostridia bacterium]|nr:hypothetical protein [Clostridia bacterium]